MPKCPRFDFNPPLRLVRRIALNAATNPILAMPIYVRFDDGSMILRNTPITIPYPAYEKTHVNLLAVLRWVCKTYTALWKVHELEWFHEPTDAVINSFFKKSGDDVWRVGFSF